jgi:hypothetical protein
MIQKGGLIKKKKKKPQNPEEKTKYFDRVAQRK